MGKRLGEILVDGFKEFTKDLDAKKPVSSKYNLRRVFVDLEPQNYSGENVKRARGLIGASQAVFAVLLGVNVKTLQKWERDENPVPTIAARFMDEIVADPSHFRARLDSVIKVRDASSETTTTSC